MYDENILANERVQEYGQRVKKGNPKELWSKRRSSDSILLLGKFAVQNVQSVLFEAVLQ